MVLIRGICTPNNNISQLKLFLNKELILPYNRNTEYGMIILINKSFNIFQIYCFDNKNFFDEIFETEEYIKIVFVYKNNISNLIKKRLNFSFNIIKNNLCMVFVNNNLNKMKTGNNYKFNLNVDFDYNPAKNKIVYYNNNQINLNDFTNNYQQFYTKFKINKILNKLEKIKLKNKLIEEKNKLIEKINEENKNKIKIKQNRIKLKNEIKNTKDINEKNRLIQKDIEYFKIEKMKTGKLLRPFVEL